jgi:hypothetical protein
MGRASVCNPPALYSFGCRLLGLEAHRLDSCHLGCGSRDPLESQTPEKSLVFASHVEAREELGKRSGIERFFGRVFLFFHLQRPPLSGWSTIARQVALTYTATIIVALAAQQAGRPDLIRSPKRVLAHTWEGF